MRSDSARRSPSGHPVSQGGPGGPGAGAATSLPDGLLMDRHEASSVALAVAIGADVALAIVLAVGLGTAGIESADRVGSWLFGAAVTSAGVGFASTILAAAACH